MNTHLAKPSFALSALIALLLSGCGKPATSAPDAKSTPAKSASTQTATAEPVVELTDTQLAAVKIEIASTASFAEQREAPGNVALNADAVAQVFPSVQGRFLKAFVALGDTVQKGQPLYAIESADLATAESTLIGAQGTFDASSRTLARVKSLSDANGGLAQKELEQATADHQTAEGALGAARDALLIFGKTKEEIDRVAASRQVDSELVVRSPVSGQITQVTNAAPGVLVQPGSGSAPMEVADLGTKWLLAYATENDIALLRPGMPVRARLPALANRVFEGTISKIHTALDSDTRRVTVRTVIADPKNELRPGMLAEFIFSVGQAADAVALPASGVVRESDGTTTAWVTTDKRHFTQRIITTGIRQNGRVQILGGVKPGELVVTEGAVFLSNMLEVPVDD